MRTIAFILWLLLATSAAKADATIDPPELARAIVRIERHEAKNIGHCTGALVARDLVVTAAHCLQDKPVSAFQVFVEDEPGRAVLELVAHGATVTGKVPADAAAVAVDWAIVRITPVDRTPISVAALSPDEIMAAAGAGHSIRMASFGGKARTLRQLGPCGLRPKRYEGYFLVTCNVDPGDSGAPVILITPDGPRLIGVVSAFGRRFGFATSATQFADVAHP